MRRSFYALLPASEPNKGQRIPLGRQFDFADLVVTGGAPGDAATECGEVQPKRLARTLSQRCAQVVVTAPPAETSDGKREVVLARARRGRRRRRYRV